VTGQPSCDLWRTGAPPPPSESEEPGGRDSTWSSQVKSCSSRLACCWLLVAGRCPLRAACCPALACSLGLRPLNGAVASRPPSTLQKAARFPPDTLPAHVNLDSGHEHPPPSNAISPPDSTGMQSSPSVVLPSDLVESDSKEADTAPDTIRSPSAPRSLYSDHVFFFFGRPLSPRTPAPLPILSNAIST
jgi:hypothetical protein